MDLIAIIDTGTNHSFILLECNTRLGLKLSSMNESVSIDTLANGFVTTVLVSLSCPLTIYGKTFAIDFVCLPLHQIDVISWIEMVGF